MDILTGIALGLGFILFSLWAAFANEHYVIGTLMIIDIVSVIVLGLVGIFVKPAMGIAGIGIIAFPSLFFILCLSTAGGGGGGGGGGGDDNTPIKSGGMFAIIFRVLSGCE